MTSPPRAFEENLDERNIGDIPEPLKEKPHARAYLGVFRLVLGEDCFAGLSDKDRQAMVDLAFVVDEVVDRSISEHSLNPQSIEARDAIGKIIHITRVKLARRDRRQWAMTASPTERTRWSFP